MQKSNNNANDKNAGKTVCTSIWFKLICIDMHVVMPDTACSGINKNSLQLICFFIFFFVTFSYYYYPSSIKCKKVMGSWKRICSNLSVIHITNVFDIPKRNFWHCILVPVKCEEWVWILWEGARYVAQSWLYTTLYSKPKSVQDIFCIILTFEWIKNIYLNTQLLIHIHIVSRKRINNPYSI